MGVSNIQKWFFSEKAFREQLRSWGWIYLFFASFSLLTGLISFGVTLRWFPISDMLRALLLDSLLTLPVMFLPGMLATGVLVLSFVPFFAATLSNVVHILLYHAPISTFAIQSIFESKGICHRLFFYSQCAHSRGRFCDTVFPPCEGCTGQKKILAAFSSVVCTGLDSLHPYRLFSRA